MTDRNARRAAKKSQNVKAPVSPAVEAVIKEGQDLGHTEASIVAEAAAIAATEAPAPVVAETPATPAAPEKVKWEDTMKKAQASFAKTGAFREGTNRFVLYPLLQREEGVSLQEASAATQERGGKLRQLSSIHTDLHDIAKITQRKLVRCDKGDLKRYKLAPVAPVAQEVKA
jgi:hypothetical protein